MTRSVYLFLIFTILLVISCSYATAEPLKTDLPPLDSVWTIKMTHSGGIMGLSRSIEISSDGKYTVTDERANKTVNRGLSKIELSKLREMVSKTEFVSAGQLPSVCADCFIYNLEIQENGKKFSVQVDDVTLPKSGMETLIGYLRGLIDAALK